MMWHFDSDSHAALSENDQTDVAHNMQHSGDGSGSGEHLFGEFGDGVGCPDDYEPAILESVFNIT